MRISKIKESKGRWRLWKNTESFFNQEISLSYKLKDKQKESFYSELGTLLDSGIDIKSAFDIIIEMQPKKKQRQLFESIKKSVINGKSLSTSLSETTLFSPYEYFSINIGEESGKINSVLKYLTNYYSGKIKQKRQFISALSYPIIVFITSLGAIFFMMYFVVPMFADIFKRFKTDLPAITKIIINVSNLAGYLVWFFIFSGIVAFAVFHKIKKSESFRKISSAIVLKIPFLGALITKIYLARFCNAMNLLLSAKTPLITSLEMTKKMVGFYPIESSLTTVKSRIALGNTLFKSLQEHSIYTPKMISLVKVGEEVNQLDKIFEKLSNQFSNEIEHNISMINSLLEPVVIIFLGLFVAIILIAMYLPLFKLSSSFGL